MSVTKSGAAKSAAAKITLIKLSRRELDAYADETNLTDRAREMAAGVLVDGLTSVVVAEQFDVSKQRVLLAVEVIRGAHAREATSRFGTAIVKVEMEVPDAVGRQLVAATTSVLTSVARRSTAQDAEAKLVRVHALLPSSIGNQLVGLAERITECRDPAAREAAIATLEKAIAKASKELGQG